MGKRNRKIKQPLVKDEELTNNKEPMIDGKKLSEVFSDVEIEESKSIKVEKKESKSKDDFEITFDPNADVVLKKKKTIWAIVRSCIAWTLVIMIGLVGGYFIGDMIVGKLDVYDPNAYSDGELRDKEENIILWQNKSITSLSAGQIFVVAEKNLNECTYFSITTKGLEGKERGIIKNSFTPQDFWGYRYRNGDQGAFSYYSEGIIPVKKQMSFKYSSGDVTVCDVVANTTEQKTAQEYLDEVGCAATSPIDYIVSTKTVLTEEKINSESGKHTYTITIDPLKSVSNYVKKMKYMSGLSEYPKFNKIEIKFTVDDNMNFVEFEVREEYKVNYGINVTCQGEFKYEFSYENIEIK